LIVHAGLTHKSSNTSSHVSSRPSTPTKHGKSGRARFYIVQPGDTLSSIAQKTGVSVSTLEALNPKLVDPNSLQAAQRLKLRR
jgi:peptidoglycan DL-endopeptidase LytE